MVARGKKVSETNERPTPVHPQAPACRNRFQKKLPSWEVCDATGRGGRTSAMALAEGESRIREHAETHGQAYVNVGKADKRGLTGLNNLFGRTAGGDECLRGTTELIPRVIERMNGGGIHLVRLVRQLNSDEFRIAMASPGPRGITEKEMKKNYCAEGRKVDRSELKYIVAVEQEDGSIVEMESDLEQAGKVLRHWELTLAWHLSLSDEILVGPDMPPGFIKQTLRDLEMLKVQKKLGDRPECFIIDDIPDGMRSPFGFSDLDLGVPSISGRLFQMKFYTANRRDTEELIKLLPITRKGWAGVLTGVLGQSDGNTFMGEPANDAVLRAIAESFWEAGQNVSGKTGRMSFQRVAGHTIYRTGTDVDPYEVALALVNRANELLPPGLRAVVASNVVNNASVDDAKAMLELHWMKASYVRPELLPHIDRLLNIIEYLKPEATDDIIGRLKAMKSRGGDPIVDGNDLKNFRLISEICNIRRTVRGAADFKAIMDHDEKIGKEMKLRPDGREELWFWVWKFAERNGKRVWRALNECVQHA